MITLCDENFDAEVEKSSTLCVIDLYADWCAPCRVMASVLESLEEKYPDVKFCKINIEDEPRLREMFRVESIPLIALVKDGVYLDMSIGLAPRSAIEGLIEQYK